MLFANVNGNKSTAFPNGIGTCPFCHSNVIARCGDVNTWHWSHQKAEDCDSWNEPETEWHKQWKYAFGINQSEVIIYKDGVKHIADIVTKDNVVIELQNSFLPLKTIHARENFYGENMIWLINGIGFKKNFEICKLDMTLGEQWYWRNEVEETQFGTVDKATGEIVTRPILAYIYSWKWPKKSWSEAQRLIYIDFGDENLVKIVSGIGEREGKCIFENKLKFLNEHGGDFSFLKALQYEFNT